MRKANRTKRTLNTKADKDRYLITYADLLTLLLGLFAILYASSQVDLSKYAEVVSSFATIFSSEAKKEKDIMNANISVIPPPIVIPKEEQSIDLVKTKFEEKLKVLLKQGKLNIEPVQDGFKIIINADLLFKSGSADLQIEAVTIIDSIASILRVIDKQINVDGHTDAVPMRSMRYESNWHLSAARALNIGYLLINKQVPEHNVVVRAFGGQRPIEDNLSEEGRKKNRRVEIVISDKDTSAPGVIENENADAAQE